MTDSYRPYLLVEGDHIGILLSPGSWLISTGTPHSFGETLACLPTGSVEVPTTLGSLTEAELNRNLRTRYLGVLGGDVLSSLEMEFNLAAGRVAMRHHLGGRLPGKCLSLGMSASSVPIVSADIEGKGRLPMIFDTGFRHSYMDEIKGNDVSPIGLSKDYHPLLGTIEVALFRLRVQIGTFVGALCFATNPKVSEWCREQGAGGVLGWEILNHRKVACLRSRRELWL